MSNLTGNQKGTEFLVGQVAQAVGDYFVLLKRCEEASEEYKEAIAAYDQVLPSSSDFVEAHKNKKLLERKLQAAAPSRVLVNLGEWLQNNFTEALEVGWYSIEALLDTQQRKLAFSLRTVSQFREGSAKLAKPINLEGQAVVLLVAVTQEANGRICILVQVHPTEEERYLPPNLRLAFLSEEGETSQEVLARSQDNYIQLPRFWLQNEGKFSIQISIGKSNLTENFGV
jgi:hypothetical protein